MDTKKRLDILEEKVDLIMAKLGLNPQPVEESIEKIDDSVLRLELQKILNEIKVCKIRFRKSPMRSPIRQQSIDRIEELQNLEKQYREQLDELHRKV